MSNDRHLTIDDGTMGNLFRRVTLATLGLDSMEGVSEQSFEVIDRADSFAARLMGGVSNVMPKIDSERLGLNATSLSDHLLEGMSGLNGPRSATDLGDWQYWLDAALLMLFDEDDEEEASLSSGKAVQRTSANKQTKATPEAVRARVAALRNSGIKPAMLQSMPQAAKRAFIEDLKKVSENKPSENGSSLSLINAAEVAETLSKTLTMASEKRFGTSYNTNAISAVERILTTNTRQTFASHIADKAAAVSAQISRSDVQNQAEVQALTDRWTRSLSAIGAHVESNASSMREMLSALDSLEKVGAIASEQAAALRRASKTYAHRVLAEEISHDALAVASRMENMVKAAHESKMGSALISQRAMTFASNTSKASVAETIKKSFATLNQRLSEFNQAVSSRVDLEGESAATVRWSRAADRFERLQGVSDDIDRILLRDVVESAVELSNVGILPQNLVQSIVSSSVQAQRAASTDKAIQSFQMISAPQTAISNQSVNDVFAQIGHTRILGNLATKIESSVDNLVKDLAKSGITGSSVDSFVSDIRQLVATGAQANVSNANRVSSVIESICARLDDFAQIAASTVVTRGYDDVATATEGTFVSATETENATQAVSQSAASSQSGSIRANMAKIQSLQASLASAKAEAQQQAQNLIRQQQTARASLAEAEQKIIDNAVSTANIESLIQAQKALAPHMTSEAQVQLAKTVESIQRSQAHLEHVAQQVKLIENTVRISENLRNASKLGNVSASPSIAMDDVRIHSDYLSALGGTLSTVAKLRSEMSAAGMAAAKSESLATSISENRLEKMLSLVTPVNTENAQSVHFASANSADVISALNHTEASIGYDDVIPSSLEWVHQAEQYPSQSSISDLTSMLGARKAVELHASDIAGGRTDSVQSLVSSITKLASEQKFASQLSSIHAYSMSEDGEHVKVSVGIQPNRTSSQSFALRNNTVESYQPVNARLPQMSSLSAALDVAKLGGEGTVSGADNFMPLIAGVNESNQAVSSKDSATFVPMETSSSEVQAQRGREAVQAILARLGIQSTSSSTNAMDGERFRLNVGGVDFDMSANAFVQMVAKPAMNTAAVSMPSSMDANNALFAGYASLLSEQGEKRTLKALRQSYVETLAKTGAMSAHSQVGFSTQSFADIMGVTPTFVNATPSAQPVSGAVAQARQDVTSQTQNDDAFVNELISKTASIESAEMSGDASYAWVSNQLRANASASNYSSSSQHEEHNAQQLLGRIDSMLDYVEAMSDRNVGVFSTDDTVRVLLEALPESSTLGNKGLPKWRQRDTKATRMAEARELREALAKIGASPVQGVSRYANKQYVSPNLLQNQSTGTAPLFSGGGNDVSTAPSASSSISKSADIPNNSTEISDDDLEYIAEEVFRKIEESLNEEQQRRRSE